jgi:glucose uptake protein GlcU
MCVFHFQIVFVGMFGLMLAFNWPDDSGAFIFIIWSIKILNVYFNEWWSNAEEGKNEEAETAKRNFFQIISIMGGLIFVTITKQEDIDFD